jgi:hypothetical protein
LLGGGKSRLSCSREAQAEVWELSVRKSMVPAEQRKRT